jgi:two-component system, OmpR family, phosphate regulon sensor histidine kinase PhoR
MTPPIFTHQSARPVGAFHRARWTFWRGPLARLTLLVIGAVLVGLMFGAAYGFALAALVLALLVVTQIRYLELLQGWLQHPTPNDIPDGWGAWSTVFSDLYRRERRESKNRDRLQAMVTRFRLGAEALPDAVVALTPDNRVEWANPRAERWLGIIEARDRGFPVTNILRAPALEQFLKSGGIEPVVLDSPRGGEILLALALIPFDERNRLLVARDVTAERRLDAMRRDFIANVSHELKTPLSVVAGFIEHLQDGVAMDPETRARIVNLIAEQTARMTRLTHDLLELSRLESDEEPPIDEWLGMPDLMAQLVHDGEVLSKGRHRLTTVCAPAGLAGNRHELMSAFGNLVANAVRYSPEGGEVALEWRLEDDGRRGVFAVKDSGIGIAPEHLPRLTERFYRVDPSRSRDNPIDGGGTGLGLAIVKHVLLRHNARLEIESVLGHGSEFRAVFGEGRLKPRVVHP